MNKIKLENELWEIASNCFYGHPDKFKIAEPYLEEFIFRIMDKYLNEEVQEELISLRQENEELNGDIIFILTRMEEIRKRLNK